MNAMAIDFCQFYILARHDLESALWTHKTKIIFLYFREEKYLKLKNTGNFVCVALFKTLL